MNFHFLLDIIFYVSSLSIRTYNPTWLSTVLSLGYVSLWVLNFSLKAYRFHLSQFQIQLRVNFFLYRSIMHCIIVVIWLWISFRLWYMWSRWQIICLVMLGTHSKGLMNYAWTKAIVSLCLKCVEETIIMLLLLIWSCCDNFIASV